MTHGTCSFDHGLAIFWFSFGAGAGLLAYHLATQR